MTTAPEVAKKADFELRLEDIGKEHTITAAHPDYEGNTLQRVQATIQSNSRRLVKYVADAGTNLHKKVKMVTVLTITEEYDPNGKFYSVLAQLETKSPKPLPVPDMLYVMETERGTPTLARGYPPEETPELPFDAK